MSEWQDISTAPKDGTRILVYQRIGGPDFVRWIGAPHNKWSIDGFGSVDKPTHWMPLPAPPVTP